MPLLHINASSDAIPLDHGQFRQLRAQLRSLPPKAPVVVLLHGYKYAPGIEGRCPHSLIYALHPAGTGRSGVSWPTLLGVGSNVPQEPLCIALGWPANQAFHRAYGQAARTGQALARLVEIVHRITPDRPVDIIAHSLGARVALSALPHLQAGRLRNLIMMTPAELSCQANALLNSPAGRSVKALNVSSGENWVFDKTLEWMLAPARKGARAMGFEPRASDCWTTLRIDNPSHLTALERVGVTLAPPVRKVCHWSAYTRQGVFDLYRRLTDGTLPMNTLASALPPLQKAQTSRRLPLSGLARRHPSPA